VKLTLHPASRPAGPVAAAFIGGADPAAWLRALSGWGLDAEEVRAYVVPQSLRTAEQLGLLVVFGSRVPDEADIAAPYTCVAGKLFIPCQAILTPAFTPDELAQRLLYPVQVFHLSAGLVGFEPADEFSFAPLLQCAMPAEGNWNEALAPAPEFPPLQSVGMPRASAENFMQQVQQEIGAKPLRQILSNEERSQQTDALQTLRLGLLGLVNRMLGGKSKDNNTAAAFLVKLFTFLGVAYLSVLSVAGLIANRPGWRDAFLWIIAALGAMLVLGMVSSMEEKGKAWKRLSTGLVVLFLIAAVVQFIHLIIQIVAYQTPSALILLTLGAAVVLLYVLYRKVVNRKESSLFSLTYLHSLNAVTIWFTSLVLIIMLTQVFVYGVVFSETWFLFGVSVAVMLLYPKVAEQLQPGAQSSTQYAAAQPSGSSTDFPWHMALLLAGGIALVLLLVFNVISFATLWKMALWTGGILLAFHLIGRLRRNMAARPGQAAAAKPQDGSADFGMYILLGLIVVGGILAVILLLRSGVVSMGIMPVLLIAFFVIRLLMHGVIENRRNRTSAPQPARAVRPSWLSRFMNWLRGGNARNAAAASGAQTATGVTAQRGWFSRWRQRVRERVQRSLEELQKRRESELDRLVRMMDENPNEGLQYAVPLNSDYLGRGGDNGWDSLSRELPDFSLGGLGSGGGGGSFTSPEHYQKLRERYLKQANLLLEKGDYRKAAYVYAHLLGDLHSAASVLEQGRYFREAAALYKDHIKNHLLAAQCLEKGGLLAEAAEEYRELKQHEKAGDLYRILAHEEKAQHMYQLCVEQALAQQNFLEAARLQHDKQHLTAAAEESLLLGWNSMHPQENCLHRYIALRTEQHESAAHTAQRLYQAGLKVQQEQIFLNQLRLIYQHAAPESNDAVLAQQLALRLISAQAQNGKHAALNQLQHFTHSDSLVQADASRYIVQNRVHTPQPAVLPEIQRINLPEGVLWRKLISGSRYWVALGEAAQKLSMVRISASGQTEQFNWTAPFTEAENLEIQHHPLLPDVIQLRNLHTMQVLCNGYMAATSPHPAALAAVFFDYLPERLLAYSAGEHENSCWVVLYHPQLSLQYWEQGKLLKQLDLHFEYAPPEALTEGSQFASYGYYADGFFYCNYLNYHLKINTTNAHTDFIELPDAAYNLQFSAYHSNPMFCMAGYHDIFVVQPGTQKVWRKILGEFVSEITFISYKHIAYYREGQLVVCELAENGQMPVVYRRPVGKELICLSAAGRNKIAWLENGGILHILDVPLAL
jgi:MoxR-vWA-beta-propeller ternary system domain bpX3